MRFMKSDICLKLSIYTCRRSEWRKKGGEWGRCSRTAVTEAVLNGAIWRQRLDDTFELVWPDRMVTAD